MNRNSINFCDHFALLQTVCSGNGKCDCGKCTCDVGYKGAHCEVCAVSDFLIPRATVDKSHSLTIKLTHWHLFLS